MIEVGYSVCGKEEESSLHILCCCDFAKRCWQYFGLGWFFGNVSSVKEWLEVLFSRIDRSKWPQIATICWAIWKNRNELIWNGKTMPAHMVVASALKLFQAWTQVKLKEILNQKVRLIASALVNGRN